MRHHQSESNVVGRVARALAFAAAAGGLLVAVRRWTGRRRPEPSRPAMADRLDEEIDESFPASDPPSHTPTSGARP
jgi:hypothetical protein